MRTLILAAGSVKFDVEDGGYPPCLSEIDGVPLLQKITERLKVLGCSAYIFVLRSVDAKRYRLGSIAALLLENSKVVMTPESTEGSACSALLAIEDIDVDEELLIVSANEFVDVDLGMVCAGFRARPELAAATIIFDSVHPRYSYVLLDDNDKVIEASQRNPISRDATVGIFWYRRGSDFVQAAKNLILKGAHIDGQYFICPTFNELILKSQEIGVHRISQDKYHPLKSERQLARFGLNNQG